MDADAILLPENTPGFPSEGLLPRLQTWVEPWTDPRFSGKTYTQLPIGVGAEEATPMSEVYGGSAGGSYSSPVAAPSETAARVEPKAPATGKNTLPGEGIAAGFAVAGNVLNMMERANQYADRANMLRAQSAALRGEYTANWRAEATNLGLARAKERGYMAAQRASLQGSGVASTSGTVQAVTEETSRVFESGIQRHATAARERLQQSMYQESLLKFELDKAKSGRLGSQIGAALGIAGAVAGAAFGGPVGMAAGSSLGSSLGNSLFS